MTGSDWSSLTVVKLKEECKKRGLPVGGKKSELVERLEQHEVRSGTWDDGCVLCCEDGMVCLAGKDALGGLARLRR